MINPLKDSYWKEYWQVTLNNLGNHSIYLRETQSLKMHDSVDIFWKFQFSFQVYFRTHIIWFFFQLRSACGWWGDVVGKMIILYEFYHDFFRSQLRLSAFRSYHSIYAILSKYCPCLSQNNFVETFLAVNLPSNNNDVTKLSAKVTYVKKLN